MKMIVYVGLMAFYGFAALSLISSIGEPRSPMTAKVATRCVVAVGLLAAGVSYLMWSGT